MGYSNMCKGFPLERLSGFCAMVNGSFKIFITFKEFSLVYSKL